MLLTYYIQFASYLFSNSPFKNKEPAYEKLRNIIWANTDNFHVIIYLIAYYFKTTYRMNTLTFFKCTAIFSLDRKGRAITQKGHWHLVGEKNTEP